MRILFICGCLEPGRDGVGDYTRILSKEFLDRGYDARILAIRDHCVSEFMEDDQNQDSRHIKVYRVPVSLGIKEGFKLAQIGLGHFNPDWVSIQYVPYAYSRQGVPWSLPRLLEGFVPSASIHLMVHEAYNHGILSIKNRAVGQGQIALLKRMAQLKRVRLVHTTNRKYKDLLMQIGISSELLGLYGNIPIAGQRTSARKRTASFLRGVYFGASPVPRDYNSIGRAIVKFLNDTDYTLELTFCGKAGADRQRFIEVLNNQSDSHKLLIQDRGMLDEKELSNLLLNMDFGISRVSPALLGKSGTAIAMLEHGLPLFIPLASDRAEIDLNVDYRPEQCFAGLDDIAANRQQYIPASRLDDIVSRLIDVLKVSHSKLDQ